MPEDFVRAAAATAFAVLLFRALPPFVAALASRRVEAAPKIATTLLYVALAAWVDRLEPAHLARFATLGSASAYWALATCALFALARAGAWAKTPGWLTFALLAIAWVVAPAWPLHGPDRAAVVLVGVEGLLSAYSAARAGRALPSLRVCLFFVLVDPTLVFSQRARRSAEPSLTLWPALRLLLGAAAVAAGVALALVAPQAPALAPPTAAGRVAGLAALAALLGTAFYAGHSGVASMQIALLALLGFRAGERYRRPFASTSPRDFWRRWNLYLGHWLRDYVYAPAARRLARRAPRPAAHALATLAAFGVCGALHGGVQLAIYGTMPWPAVAAFVVQGAALLAWDATTRPLRTRTPAARLAARVASRAIFVPFSLAMLLWLYPALAGGGRPSPPTVTAHRELTRKSPGSWAIDPPRRPPPLRASMRRRAVGASFRHHALGAALNHRGRALVFTSGAGAAAVDAGFSVVLYPVKALVRDAVVGRKIANARRTIGVRVTGRNDVVRPARVMVRRDGRGLAGGRGRPREAAHDGDGLPIVIEAASAGVTGRGALQEGIALEVVHVVRPAEGIQRHVPQHRGNARPFGGLPVAEAPDMRTGRRDGGPQLPAEAQGRAADGHGRGQLEERDVDAKRDLWVRHDLHNGSGLAVELNDVANVQRAVIRRYRPKVIE